MKASDIIGPASRAHLILLCLAIGAFSLGCEDDEDEPATDEEPQAETNAVPMNTRTAAEGNEPAPPPVPSVTPYLGSWDFPSNTVLNGISHTVALNPLNTGNPGIILVEAVGPDVGVSIDLRIIGPPEYSIETYALADWDTLTLTASGTLNLMTRPGPVSGAAYTIEFADMSNGVLRVRSLLDGLVLPISRENP